ncbi:MAG: hypothetical protein AAF465_01830 [Pseudomonadota bacterium]
MKSCINALGVPLFFWIVLTGCSPNTPTGPFVQSRAMSESQKHLVEVIDQQTPGGSASVSIKNPNFLIVSLFDIEGVTGSDIEIEKRLSNKVVTAIEKEICSSDLYDQIDSIVVSFENRQQVKPNVRKRILFATYKYEFSKSSRCGSSSAPESV